MIWVIIVLGIFGYLILCCIENWMFESDYERAMGIKIEEVENGKVFTQNYEDW